MVVVFVIITHSEQCTCILMNTGAHLYDCIDIEWPRTNSIYRCFFGHTCMHMGNGHIGVEDSNHISTHGVHVHTHVNTNLPLSTCTHKGLHASNTDKGNRSTDADKCAWSCTFYPCVYSVVRRNTRIILMYGHTVRVTRPMMHPDTHMHTHTPHTHCCVEPSYLLS